MKRLPAALALVLTASVLAACGGPVSAIDTVGSGDRPRATPDGKSRGTTDPVSSPSGPTPLASPPAVFLPAPSRPVSADPTALAATLTRTTVAMRASIEAWTSRGDPSGRPPEPLVLQVLYQQRIYRALARHTEASGQTISSLPGWLRGEARANTAAVRELLSLARPFSGPSGLVIGRPLPAGLLLRYFKEAEARFGVAWEVLAAVNQVESKFGRVKSTSYAGARGPMQFIPSTWAAYGMAGDVGDPHDAILGAANYLRASGAPGDYRRALYAYNHSWDYVDAILAYAHQMMGDPSDYYAYYNWQVFVVTASGDRRLSGPGAVSER